MEKNKYYIPKLEDLFIGYVCEHTTVPSSFQTKDTDSIYWDKLYCHELINIIKWVNEEGYDLSQFVRTPYLSAEQLESEGWTVIEPDPNYIILEKEMSKWRKWNMLLDTVDHEVSINYMQNNSNMEYPVDECVFNGKCPSINEFRYITKLIGIQ